MKGRNRGKAVSAILLLISLSLVSCATYNGINTYSQNVTTSALNGYEANLTPGTLYVPSFMQKDVVLQLTVQGKSNFSKIIIDAVSGSRMKQLINASLTPRPYFLADFRLPADFLNGTVHLLVIIDSETSLTLPVKLSPSYTGLISEVILFAGAGMFVAFLFSTDLRSRKYWLLLPLFIALSALYGQRYDDYFMISLGARIADGVDPYIRSVRIPPGLYWEYLPGYAPWSYISIMIYHYVTGNAIPGWQQLVYPGAYYQNKYSAWKALRGMSLYFLYSVVKVPFVLAFFWIGGIIARERLRVPWKLWILNPMVIVIGVMWGQLDVLALGFMMQSVVFHGRKRDLLATLTAGVGALIKPFPVFIVPYLLFRSRNKGYALLGFASSVLIGLALYAISGNITADLRTIILGRTTSTYLGIFTTNGLTWQTLITALGVTHFPSLFEYVFIPGYAVISYLAIRKQISVYSYFLLSMLLFFLTYNVVNPQYLIWVLVPLIMLGLDGEGVLFSVLGSLYIFLDYSYTYFLNPELSWNYISSPLGQIEQLRVSITGSAISMVIFGILSSAVFAVVLLNTLRREFSSRGHGDTPLESQS